MRVWTTVPAALCLLLAAGCATPEILFEVSPRLPAADASARVHYDRNHNTVLEIEVDHMAQAERLSPPRSVYVVWVESPKGRVFQIGRLLVDERRQARFQGSTPLARFRVIVSAEADVIPVYPTQPYMLVTELYPTGETGHP